MSSSDETSSILLIDHSSQILQSNQSRLKIRSISMLFQVDNKRANSNANGWEAVEEHREKGADLDVDVPF